MTENLLFSILSSILSFFTFPPFGIALLGVLINLFVEKIPRLFVRLAVLVVLALLMAVIEPLIGPVILSTLPATLFIQILALTFAIGEIAVSLIPFTLLQDRFTRKWQSVYVFLGGSFVTILSVIQGLGRLGELHRQGAGQLPYAESYWDLVIQILSHYPWILIYALIVYGVLLVFDTNRRNRHQTPIQNQNEG